MYILQFECDNQLWLSRIYMDGAVASLQLHRAKLCQSGLAVRKAHIHPTLERKPKNENKLSFLSQFSFARYNSVVISESL